MFLGSVYFDFLEEGHFGLEIIARSYVTNSVEHFLIISSGFLL